MRKYSLSRIFLIFTFEGLTLALFTLLLVPTFITGTDPEIISTIQNVSFFSLTFIIYPAYMAFLLFFYIMLGKLNISVVLVYSFYLAVYVATAYKLKQLSVSK